MAAPRHRWVVFGGLVGVYFSFGVAVAAIAPMLSLVRDDLGATRGEMGLALGAWALVYIVTAPLAGRFIDRFGLGWSLLLGGLSVVGSLLLRAAAQGIGTLWLAVAFFGVFGPLISASAPTLMANWFPDDRERRRGVGLYAAAPALGGTITIAVTNPVLLEWFDSWRSVLVFEATIGAGFTAVWLVIWNLVERPEPHHHDDDSATTGTLGRLIASTEIRLILVMAFAVFFVNHALGTWMPTVLEEFGGYSPTAAGAWVAVAGVFAIVATAVLPGHATPERMHRMIAALLLISGAAVMVIAVAPSEVMGPAAIVTSVRSALVPIAIVTLLESDRVTPANTGFANGLWFSVAEIGGVTGPLTLGAIADSGMGYRGALTVVAALGLAAAALALLQQRVHSASAAEGSGAAQSSGTGAVTNSTNRAR